MFALWSTFGGWDCAITRSTHWNLTPNGPGAAETNYTILDWLSSKWSMLCLFSKRENKELSLSLTP